MALIKVQGQRITDQNTNESMIQLRYKILQEKHKLLNLFSIKFIFHRLSTWELAIDINYF